MIRTQSSGSQRTVNAREKCSERSDLRKEVQAWERLEDLRTMGNGGKKRGV